MSRPQHQAIRLVLAALSLFGSPLALGAGESPQPGDSPSGEVKPTDPNPAFRLQPALISVTAKQGGTMSFKEQEPSKLLGGVRLGYEEVLVLCDHVDYWQSKLMGVKRAVLDHALFAAGPEAEEPEHVVFDSRASKLPQISFRGVMKPSSVEIIRQQLTALDQARLEERRLREKATPQAKSDPNGTEGKDNVANPEAAPAEPSVLVRYRVLMHKFGEFTGDLKTTDGWVPHFGWAEEVEVTVVCDILPDGIANPRFSAIQLKGRPASEGVAKRPARLGQKQPPVVGAAVKKEFDAAAYDWWGESSSFTIEFDDQGRVLRFLTGADYRGEGTPRLDTPVQTPGNAQTPEAVAPAKP